MSINHIAIIMDGNRRWAKKKGLPQIAGHKYVLDKALEPLIEHAAKLGIKYLTFWAWSTENWHRDSREVTGIMKLFKSQIAKKGRRLHEKGIQVKIIGDISRFDPGLRKEIANLVELTKDNTRITVVFALNYGGRDEIVRAIDKCIKYQVSRLHLPEQSSGGQASINDKNMTHDTLTRDTFSQHLDTSGIPDPDMIIRTGGERRLSGFLLWQSEYSELFFPDFFMPDFTSSKLDQLIKAFESRQRRFGK